MNSLGGLRQPHFRRAFVAGSIVTITQWQLNTVLVAHAFSVSQSAPLVGLIVLGQFGPTLILGLPMGVLADRTSRRAMMLIGVSIQVASAVGAVALALTSSDPVALVVVAAAFGVGQAIYGPAFVAALPTLLPEAQLSAAVALNSAQLSVGRVIGPPLGALLYVAVGPAGAFVLGMLLACVALALFGFVRPPYATTEPERLLRSTFGGFAVARQDPIVRQCLICIAIFSVCCMPISSHMPELASTVGISTDEAAFSILLGAFGIGTITGGITVTVIARAKHARVIARIALVAFGVVLLAVSLGFTLGWVAGWLVGLGIAYFFAFTALSIRLQSRLALAVRGRVMAMWVVSFGGMLPVGAAIAGPIIEWVSLSAVLQFGAIVAVALGLVGTRRTSLERHGTRS